jgi:hypothetical protein
MSEYELLERRASSGYEEDDWVAIPSASERLHSLERNPAEKIVQEGVNEGIVIDMFDRLLSEMKSLYSFSPQVRFGEDGKVYMWLAELGVYGIGANYDEAAWSLVEEVGSYLEDWESGISSAPNHAKRVGWVRRLQVDRSPEHIFQVLFE